MVYILGSKLIVNKNIYWSLIQIFGINRFRSFLICKLIGFCLNLKVKDISKTQIIKLLKFIELKNLVITNKLKKIRLFIIKKLLTIKCFKGLKLFNLLPVKNKNFFLE